MSADREEIRWKFQVMLENMGAVIDEVENERKLIDKRYIQAVKSLEKMRSYWFAGIGIFMIITASYIFAKDLEGWTYLWIIIPGIIGFVIFFITNLYLDQTQKLFREVDDTYFQAMKSEFIPLKGMVSTLAIGEGYTKENMTTIINYVATYGQAISYELSYFMNEKLKLQNFDRERYRNSYELAKSSIEKWKEVNFSKGTVKFEKFIKDFEKKDKKTKTKNN